MTEKIWTSCTVVCIASGPSLTAADCKLIEKSGLLAIAVNTSWKLARFADVIYAGDKCWWDANISSIDIPAKKVTCTQQAAYAHSIELHRCYGEYNSGMRAIQYAIDKGADKVILLGYDCSLANGSHWHGHHEKTANPDTSKVKGWHRQFNIAQAYANAKKVQVVNCSRYTELKCFKSGLINDHI